MGKCRIFKIDDNLKPVVEHGLYMKHLFGQLVSVSVVKFVHPAGPGVKSKSHNHGEEASLQLRGSCSVIQGEDSEPQRGIEYPMNTGDAIVIGAGLRHFGTNQFDEQGICLRFNVVTPPRKEFGPEDTTPYDPLSAQSAPK